MQIALLLPRINSLQFGKANGGAEAAPVEPLGTPPAGFGSRCTRGLPITVFFSGWMERRRKVNPGVTFSRKLMHPLVYT